MSHKRLSAIAIAFLSALPFAQAAQIDVVLIAGQSNAAGRAPSSGLPADPNDTGVEYFYTSYSAGGTEFSSGGVFVPLAAVNSSFGPEFGLTRRFKSEHGISDLAVIKRARGGTNLFSDWSPGGSQYDPFIADCTTALQLIIDRGDTFRILGLAWHQGERDGVAGRTTAQYQADLHAFLATVRQDLHEAFPTAGFEDLKVALGEVFSSPEIGVAQEAVGGMDGGARFVGTDDLNLFDGLHFDAPGQLAMGERMADTLIALRDGDTGGGGPTSTTTVLAGPWYTGSASATAGVPSISNRNSDSFTWGSGTAAGGSSATRGMVWSYFPAVALAGDGDSVTLRFNATYSDYSTTDAGANGFRFGIYDSNGSKLEADIANSNSSDSFLPSRGYGSMWAPTAGGSGSGLYVRSADRNNPLSTGANTSIASGAGAGASATGVSYPAWIRIARDSASQLSISSSYNGTSINATTALMPATEFDSAFILNTNLNGVVNSLQLSGLEVEHATTGPALPPLATVRISEIHHDGAAPFVELINTGASTVDLTGLRFTRGIVLTITSGTLAAGERVAFTASEFSGTLAAAETLRLEDGYQRLVDEVGYGGSPAWPSAPGRSLTLIDAGDPATDSSDPANWRASFVPGGSPGTHDRIDFATWRARYGITNDAPGLDSDFDGEPDYLEFGGGSNPLDPKSRTLGEISGSAGMLTLNYTRDPTADGPELMAQSSTDLRLWSGGEGEGEVTGVSDLGNGNEGVTVQFTMTNFDHRFMRISARPDDFRPNVLFIAVDDLRPQLGAYATAGMVTPNMDRLAAEGRLFNKHYVQCPTCGASRYALMTSRRPRTSAATSNGAFGSLFQNTNDPANPNSLPQAFRFAGYKTVGLGKLSHNPDGGGSEMPGAWDEAYMTSGIWGNAWDAFFAYAGGDTRNRGVSLRTEIGVAGDGVTSLADTDYPDGLMAEEAITRLREFKANGDRFFFGLGFFKPHLPFCAPKKYWDLYDRDSIIVPPQTVPSGVNNSLTLSGNGEFIGNYGGTNTIDEAEAKLSIHGYNACVSYVDAQIGKVLDELDTLGLREETIVVLWGDHGWHLGEHTVWGKHTTLEESLRSSLIVRTPFQPRRGVAAESFAESIDIYPTLCDLCDIPIPGSVEGQSFASALRDPVAIPKDFALGLWRKSSTDGYSIRTDRYRLVRWGNNAASPTQIDLFDYASDPEGKQNVAGSNPTVVNELLGRISGL